jgi:predicted hotdog family 3-hydroxylacyl-ACP dehydratase
MALSSPWPGVEALVPHRGVARLIARIVSASKTSIHAVGEIPAGHPLAEAGAAPACLALELGAQSAAALEAIGRQAASAVAEPPRRGSLVRIREARFDRATLPVGTPIEITAELIGSAPPLAIYAVRATLDSALVVQGIISTFAGLAGGSQ